MLRQHFQVRATEKISWVEQNKLEGESKNDVL